MIGGKRPGAGRKKGSPNKRTAARKAEIAAGGEMPLDYMLRIMRDPDTEPPRRDDMAKAAAKFIHPALATTDASIQHKGKVKIEVGWRRSFSESELQSITNPERSSNDITTEPNAGPASSPIAAPAKR